MDYTRPCIYNVWVTQTDYSEQVKNYIPHRRGAGNIVFGADPVGVGVGVGVGGGVGIDVGVTLSCMHDISHTDGCVTGHRVSLSSTTF